MSRRSSFSSTFGPSWQEAEMLAEHLVRSMGFPDARCTALGADGGLDVVGAGLGVQVKAQTSPVGRPAVQRLMGAAHDRPTRVFFSTSGYTTAASTYATEAGVALFQLGIDGDAWPVNDPAVELAGGHDHIAGPSRSRLGLTLRSKGRVRDSDAAGKVALGLFLIPFIVMLGPLLFAVGREAQRRAKATGTKWDRGELARQLLVWAGGTGALFLMALATQNGVWAVGLASAGAGAPGWGALLGVVLGVAVLVGIDRLVASGMLSRMPLPGRLTADRS